MAVSKVRLRWPYSLWSRTTQSQALDLDVAFLTGRRVVGDRHLSMSEKTMVVLKVPGRGATMTSGSRASTRNRVTLSGLSWVQRMWLQKFLCQSPVPLRHCIPGTERAQRSGERPEITVAVLGVWGCARTHDGALGYAFAQHQDDTIRILVRSLHLYALVQDVEPV